MVQFGAIRSRQKVVQLLAEILKQKSQWRFRRVRVFRVFRPVQRSFVRKGCFTCMPISLNDDEERRSILFPYSDLTAFITCWSPHALSTGGRSSRNRSCSIKFSIRSTGTSFRPLSQTAREGTFPAIVYGRASDSWLETIKKRAKQVLSVQFGAIFGLIVSFFRLIAQTMRRRLTPRSRLRRRRIAEFELAKPRIHPAEFYGGNEDDSADGPVQGAIQVWKP